MDLATEKGKLTDIKAACAGLDGSGDEPWFSTEKATGARRTQTGRAASNVSDREIAQLMTLSLENALLALETADPEEWLQLRAFEMRSGIRDALQTLPAAQARDAIVQSEYRKAIVFQNLTLDLALKIVESVRSYGKVIEREAAVDTAQTPTS